MHTDDPTFPFVIAAPTMRVPMILRDSVNPYLAARAVILLVRHGTFPGGPFAGEPIQDVIKTVAFPGLGTGVGGLARTPVPAKFAAIEEFLIHRRSFPATWADAQARHQLLYTNRIRDLQKD